MTLPVVHNLKTWPAYFSAVCLGSKNFECRKDDRGFNVGDTLILHEYDPDNGYTGGQVTKAITYILRDFEGVVPGWCVMGLK